MTTSGSNALFTNPGCLAMIEDKVFQGGMRFKFGSWKSEYSGDEYSDNSEGKYPFHIKINHLSYAMPYQIQGSSLKTVFAVGYRTYYDWGYNIHYTESNAEYDYDYDSTYKRHGGLNTLTFGGGINFQDKFYAGLAMNIGVMGKVSWEEEYTENGETESYDGDYTVKGSFFTLGGVYKVNPKMDMGFYYRPGFKVGYEFDGESSDDDVPGLLAVSSSYQISDAFKFIFEYQTRGLGDYKRGNDDIYDVDNGYALRLGAELGKKIRAGFYMDSVPLKDTDSNGESEKTPNTMKGFTLGTGFDINPNLSLDIFGEYAFTGYEREESENYNGSTTSYSLFKFGVGFVYKIG
ncbi:MAG: hypothetical protein P9M05_12255 [Candidatus Stygibacter australis]|nr:hypothetical protein [Candidatus Stygibacter australis]